MKKIIAMLLCVAMVAAFAVNAFAAGPFKVDATKSSAAYFYDELVNGETTAVAGSLAAYAEQLSAAKKEFAAAKKSLGDLLGVVNDAVKTAQYQAVATYYEAAAVLYEEAANEALANFYYSVAEDLFKDGAVVGDLGTVMSYK